MEDPRRGKGRERGRGKGSGREEHPKQSVHKNDIRNMLLLMLILNLRYKKKKMMIGLELMTWKE